VALSCLLLVLGLRLNADILTNYTLTGNETFTSPAGSTFTIGSSGSTVLNLQANTATFSGSGAFQVNSKIQGTGGQVTIDMTDPNAVVTYTGINSYTGLTTVRSGILNLDTADKSNNGLSAAIVIGGGPNQAILTRPTTGTEI
jgi:autotransporter-associated beta strand protein